MNRRLLILVLILYVLFPLDLVPDVFPVVGYLDDLAALVATVVTLRRQGTPPSAGGTGAPVAIGRLDVPVVKG